MRVKPSAIFQRGNKLAGVEQRFVGACPSSSGTGTGNAGASPLEPLSEATCLCVPARSHAGGSARRQGTPLVDFFSILLSGWAIHTN